MDPKTPANLDPKLKEVYERVMGTPTSTSQPQEPITPTPPPPAEIKQEETQPQTIATARAETISPVGNPLPQPHHETTHHPLPKTSFVATQTKQASSLMPLIILGLMIFFAAYTVFWLKFFNITIIPLPF